MDWAVLTFDKSLSAEQREGIEAIMEHVFPVKWKSFTTAEGTIDKWEYTKDEAHALLDGGKTAEVKLKRFAGMTDEPIVIKNLSYWGVPRNDGFVLMPNEVEAYRVGDRSVRVQGHQRLHDHVRHRLARREVMAFLIMEKEFDPPLSAERARRGGAAPEPCLDAHGVRWNPQLPLDRPAPHDLRVRGGGRGGGPRLVPVGGRRVRAGVGGGAVLPGRRRCTAAGGSGRRRGRRHRRPCRMRGC